MAEKPELEKLCKLHRTSLEYINLNPIQRGGILPEETKKVVSEWIDGYSVCDFCEGSLDTIKNPPVEEFTHKILPEFLGSDLARLTGGARESKHMVMHSLCQRGDAILIDGNAHYSTYVAAEREHLRIHEVESSGYPEYRIDEEDYARKIEEVKPKLVLLTWPDGNYGNLPNAEKVGKICQEYNVPFLLNGAYAVGRMPVNMKKLNADFITASGHKSMASSGPIGVLGMQEEFSKTVLRKSEKFKKKELELLGCGPRGLPTITLMASFPFVVERVKNWDKEVKNACLLVKSLENIGGIKQLGIKPTQHDLNFLESELFYKISQKHKKGRFFLYHELKKRSIVGIKPGLTKNFKLSTYGLKRDELKKVIDGFVEIAKIN